MTPTDAFSVQPAARPEPSAAKAAAPNEKGKSFADVLDTETTGASDEPTDVTTKEENSTATSVAPPTTQPAPPPVTPVTASPAAILAGLNPDAVVANGPETAADDGATPAVIPEISVDALAPTPAVANAGATPSLGIAPGATAAAEQLAVAQPPATQPSAGAPSKPAAKKDIGAETADSSSDSADITSSDDTVTVQAKPAATSVPTQAIAATALPLAPATVDQSAQSTSSPGAERAAAAIETAPSSTNATDAHTKSASTGTSKAASTASAKTAQVAAVAADATPEIKADAVTSGTTSVSAADTLTAARTSGAETGKAAQASPAAQTAPAATVQVYSRMIERFDGRAQRYEIRLDPAELGRVDVRIEVGADKKVHAVLAAHDSAALTDLMRGQRALEASLRQAGIDVADGGIKFELSNETGHSWSNGASQGETSRNGQGSSNVWRNFSTVDMPADANVAAAARPWRSSRLDLMA